jgi:hypothetical protein
MLSFLHLKESVNFQLEADSMQLEMLRIKCKGNYASVFAQEQGSPIGEFSLFLLLHDIIER